MKVYLAGPISGLTYDEAQRWRNTVADSLAPKIQCYSPLRGKDFLKSEGLLTGAYAHNPLSTSKGIVTRDHWDVKTSDLLFVNLLGATARVSQGTIYELAWAFAYRKTVVLVMEPEGNIHDYIMTQETVGYRVPTIAQALELTRAILLPMVSTPRRSLPNYAAETPV